jgi:hypothetical protein
MDNAVSRIPGLLAGAFVIACYAWSLVWAYRDAESRGKSGLLVALLVGLLSWPISLLVWIVFRPNRSTALPT